MNFLINIYKIFYQITLMNFFIIFLLLSSSSFHFITTIRGQEISRRRTRNVCNDHQDCPRNAFCERFPDLKKGQCVCPLGYIILANNDERECYKTAITVGESCLFHEQCMITLSTESECRWGRCECQNGTHFVERTNTCYKSVRIGSFCTFTNNCLGEGVVCRSGVCTCPYGHHANFAMTNCIKDVNLGGLCTRDDECLADFSRCQETCKCRTGYVTSKNNETCLKVSNHVYDCCSEDTQCQEIVPNTKCDLKNRTCVCERGYHEIKYRCWVSVPLGGVCEADENCATNDQSYCWQGRCVCRENFRNIKGKCSSSFKLLYNQRLLTFLLLFIYLFKF